MQFLSKLFFIPLVLGILACNDKGGTTPTPNGPGEGSLSRESAVLFANANTTTVTINTEEAWSATAADSWVTLSPQSGTGTTSVTISAEANAAGLTKNSTVTFKIGDKSIPFAIAQKGNTSIFKMVHTDVAVPSGVKAIQIPIETAKSYSVESDQSWLTWDENLSDAAHIVMNVTDNTAIAPRTAKIKITSSIDGANTEADVHQYAQYNMDYGYNEKLSAQAFPGAEGGGAVTTGGRGGKVYLVTSLADNNVPGTLRYAVNQTGARTVVFQVSGVIELTSTLKIKNGDLTIAGQTAPGDGICLKNYTTNVDADNVIIRFIRFRMGDEKQTADDALWGRERRNIIIDHCSMSWCTDECSSFYDNTNFTMQWCYLTESLRVSVHGKGNHGYGGIWGGQTATFHHNLLAHHDSRNPRMCGTRFIYPDPNELCDIRNNVIFNWGGNSGYAGEGGRYNFVNNYYKPGPASRNTTRIFQPNADDGSNQAPAGTWGSFFVQGNHMLLVNGNENASVINDNWVGITPNPSSKNKNELKATPYAEYALPAVTTHSAKTAFDRVLDYGGCSHRRDVVDTRVAGETRTGKPTFLDGGNGSANGLIDTQAAVGGWPTYNSSAPLPDTDQDGIPDLWEIAYGLNSQSAEDANAKTLDKRGVYTNLEVYLHNLVQHIVNEQLK